MVKCAFKTGYTLIELLVVLSVIGIISLISFLGLKDFNQKQNVDNAAYEFVSTLRGLQNKVNVGGDHWSQVLVSIPKGGNAYYIKGAGHSMPSGVYISHQVPAYSGWMFLCVSNPNETSIQPTPTGVLWNDYNNPTECSAVCGTGQAGFYCIPTTTKSDSPQTITFSNSDKSYIKKVLIYASGLYINRIYVQ